MTENHDCRKQAEVEHKVLNNMHLWNEVRKVCIYVLLKNIP